MKKLYTIVFLLAFFVFAARPNYSFAVNPVGILSFNPPVTATFGDTSISAQLQTPTVTIFPNPVKTYATISFTYDNIDKISILNIVGKEVKSINPDPGIKEIKVSFDDLQPGVYFLAVYYNGTTLITKKFLKEQ